MSTTGEIKTRISIVDLVSKAVVGICSLAILCLPILTACAPHLISSPNLSALETPTPVTTLPPIPTASSTQTPLPVTSPTTGPNFSPILYLIPDYETKPSSFLLLGGVENNTWLSAVVTAVRITEAMEYDFYYAMGTSFRADGQVPERDRICKSYIVKTGITSPGSGWIGVTAGWPVVLRETEEILTDSPIYLQAAKDWISLQGITAPQVTISRVIRVDIEGDGIDEVFISASHFSDESGHLAGKEDYSVALMRRVVGNNVVTIPLITEFFLSSDPELVFPYIYRIGNVIDLNNDGIMEVVVQVSRWEGFGAIVYQIDGQNVAEAMRAICEQ